MTRLRLDQALDREPLGVGFGILHQMQHDAGAARRRRHPSLPRRRGRVREGIGRHNRKRALAVRRPLPRRFGPGAARNHVDPVGHHEGRIKPDTEAADQRRLLAGVGLVGLEAIDKRLGARARDGAERLGHLVAAHADAVILDGEALLLGVERQRDARLDVVAEELRLGDRLIAQPLAGIRRIGDQFAQKHRLVGVDRVHHQLQKLGDVGLEGLGLEGLGLERLGFRIAVRRIVMAVSRGVSEPADGENRPPFQDRGVHGRLSWKVTAKQPWPVRPRPLAQTISFHDTPKINMVTGRPRSGPFG